MMTSTLKGNPHANLRVRQGPLGMCGQGPVVGGIVPRQQTSAALRREAERPHVPAAQARQGVGKMPFRRCGVSPGRCVASVTHCVVPHDDAIWWGRDLPSLGNRVLDFSEHDYPARLEGSQGQREVEQLAHTQRPALHGPCGTALDRAPRQRPAHPPDPSSPKASKLRRWSYQPSTTVYRSRS
jgi:hypothetical protein